MAADWDADSPRLRRNLAALLESLADEAGERKAITASAIQHWHHQTMRGLKVPDASWVGRFRGEPGLARLAVFVGAHAGAAPEKVAAAVRAFEQRLADALEQLDLLFPIDAELTVDGLSAVVELAGWAHAEWVRIHPFANGNGRTARILANVILMRYGLPPALRLRPRPDGGYADAAARAMQGEHAPTVALVLQALRDLAAP